MRKITFQSFYPSFLHYHTWFLNSLYFNSPPSTYRVKGGFLINVNKIVVQQRSNWKGGCESRFSKKHVQVWQPAGWVKYRNIPLAQRNCKCKSRKNEISLPHGTGGVGNNSPHQIGDTKLSRLNTRSCPILPTRAPVAGDLWLLWSLVTNYLTAVSPSEKTLQALLCL